MATAAGEVLARPGPGGEMRLRGVEDAMATLRNALRKDPYGPEATYQLAVAYALAGSRSCALALLERLAALEALPDAAEEAARAVQRAARDPVFEPYRSDTRGALGL